MKSRLIAVVAGLFLCATSCAKTPIAEGTYVDASSDGNLTFGVYAGKLGVGGKTPTGAIWTSVYKYIDKDTVQAGQGDFRMTMRFSPDRNEVVVTDHLGNSTKFRKKPAEPTSGGDSSTRTNAGLGSPQK